jgi:hypothetical protein
MLLNLKAMPQTDMDFGDTDGHASEAEPPWTRRPAILDHIRHHVDPISGRLRDEGWKLPDEPPRSSNVLRWAPGARDGVYGHHPGSVYGVTARDSHTCATLTLPGREYRIFDLRSGEVIDLPVTLR